MVGGSCKRRDKLRDIQTKKISDALLCGDISCGRGLNQETGLQRPGDTRWGSHYGTLLNLIGMFEATIEVLQFIIEDGLTNEQKSDAYLLLEGIVTFEFIFNLHLMKKILGLTNDLSQTLQRKDQDIVNAVRLVKICKRQFQEMRDDGWESLLTEVSSFCAKLTVEVPDMDSTYVVKGRPRRGVENNTNIYHYRVELFYTVIDMHVQELNTRFSEANTELLLCVSCLDPADSFSAFDKQKLIRLAEFYPVDFSPIMILNLQDQLDIYKTDMRMSDEFSNVKGIDGLAKKLVETMRHLIYPLVFLLLKFALILPVATASVEQAFSKMNIVKNRLRNRMGCEWMNDSLVTYIEKEIFDEVKNEAILERFQNMKPRRFQL